MSNAVVTISVRSTENIFHSGVMKYTDHIEVDSWVLRIMFSFYMVAGNFFLLNLFISVINEFLTYIHEHPEEVEFDYELSDYMKVR